MVVGFVLIGTGSISEEHAKAIKKIKNAKLVGVFSRDAERGMSFARKYNVKSYSEINNVLNDSEINALDIANQNYLHGDYALLGINAGKHVIIEKPIDISVAKARKIVEYSRKKNVNVTVISQYRFGKGFRKLKKMVESGDLGKLIMGVVVIGKHRDEKDYDSGGGWKKNKKMAGGGVLMLNAVHYINILKWIFGDVKNVKGEISTLTHDIEVEDTGGVLLKFKNNSIATVAATTSLKFNIPDRVEVYGSRASVVLENGRIVRKFKKNRIYSLIASKLGCLNYTKPGCIREQIENFVYSIENNKGLESNAEEGLSDLEVFDKVYK